MTDIEPVDYEALVFEDPWMVVRLALMQQARGRPLEADHQEAVEMASMVIASVFLVKEGGMTIDAVEALFTEREHTIRISYDSGTDAFGLDIKWDDGEVTSLSQEGGS